MIDKSKFYNWHPEITLASVAGDEQNRFILTAKVNFKHDCVVYYVKQCSRTNNAEVIKEIPVNYFSGAVEYINKLAEEHRSNWKNHKPLIQIC